MTSAMAVSVADVAKELGVPAVRRQIRMFAASGQHERAAAVRGELLLWLLGELWQRCRGRMPSTSAER